jgi:PAS domain S-box-containing protein
MNNKNWRILLIEDLPVYISLLDGMFSSQGTQLDVAVNLSEGIHKICTENYQAVLLDLGLPDSQGLNTFIEFDKHCKQTPVVIFSSMDDEQIAIRAVQLGAQDYLLKGSYLIQGEAGHSLILRSISYAIERYRIQKELIEERNLLEFKVDERTKDLQKANDQLIFELAERKQYEFMANTTHDPTALIDRNFHFQAVNDAYCRVNNLTREKFLYKSIHEVLEAEKCSSIYEPLLKKAFGGHEAQYEGYLAFNSAMTSGYYEVTFSPYRNSDNRVSHVVVVHHDETARKANETQIRQHNSRLSLLHQISQLTLASNSLEELASEVLKKFKQLVPFQRAYFFLPESASGGSLLIADSTLNTWATEQLTFDLSDILAQPAFIDSQPAWINLEVISLANPPWSLLKSYGEKEILFSPMVAEGEAFGVLVLSSDQQDIFDTDHIESTKALSTHLALMLRNSLLMLELSKVNTRLRNLTASLVSAQENERRRISLELHDEAGQFLSALQLSLNLLQKELEGKDEEHSSQIQNASQLTDVIIGKLRTLAHGLRPPSLDAVGLHQAFTDYFNRFSRQSGIDVRYSGTEISHLPEYIQITLYRMAQEAFTNILKYAKATQAEVLLQCDAEKVSLEVSDNGVGFILPAPLEAGSSGGIGLLGINDRIEAIGGILTISSKPGAGTRLYAVIPLQEEL